MNKQVTTIDRVEALLLNQKQIFNFVDFCRYTGFSESHAYKLTKSRKLPFSKPNGKLIFFKKDDVDAYLTSNPVISVDDIEQDAINFVTKKSIGGGLRWKS